VRQVVEVSSPRQRPMGRRATRRRKNSLIKKIKNQARLDARM
jgi:hypothetical protein